jgi:hypothetical protein
MKDSLARQYHHYLLSGLYKLQVKKNAANLLPYGAAAAFLFV